MLLLLLLVEALMHLVSLLLIPNPDRGPNKDPDRALMTGDNEGAAAARTADQDGEDAALEEDAGQRRGRNAGDQSNEDAHVAFHCCEERLRRWLEVGLLSERG